MTLNLNHLFYLAGFVLLMTAVITLTNQSNPKRYSSALFWFICSLFFLVGELLPSAWVGGLVILMTLIAGLKGVSSAKYVSRTDAEYMTSVKRLGHKLFIPSLIIPLVTMIGTFSASYLLINGTPLIELKNSTLVSVVIGCIIALGVACLFTRETPMQGLRESVRLTDALGWSIVLPQMLAMLGLVFYDAGVGKAVAHITTTYINMDYRFFAVVVYVVGTALFTVIMGNGFAAFPVMTGGVGVPILIGVYKGDPAVMAAIGMLSGYCGTLITPMAANFNLIPATLLEIDKNAVIRAQVPTAILLLTCNIFLLNFLMFR